jgi:hypothetical protein
MIGTHERNGPVGLRALVARVKPSTSLDGGSSNPDRPRADCELHDKPFVDSTLAGHRVVWLPYVACIGARSGAIRWRRYGARAKHLRAHPLTAVRVAGARGHSHTQHRRESERDARSCGGGTRRMGQKKGVPVPPNPDDLCRLISCRWRASASGSGLQKGCAFSK